MKGMAITRNPTNFNKYQFLNRETQFETGYIDLIHRQYDSQTGRFTSQDPVTDGQEHLSLYQYGWNNPIIKTDPNGLEPCCGELINFTTGFKNAVIEDNSPIGLNLIKSSSSGSAYSKGVTAGHVTAMVLGAVETIIGIGGDAVAVVGEVATLGGATPAAAPLALGSTTMILHGGATVGKSVSNLNSEGGNYNRVKPRKGTLEKVKENQPRNEKGEMIDPNTKQPLKEGQIDLGHKPGNEWRTRKAMHKEKGNTRKDVIETENNPNLYHLEDRNSNRSHKYEKNNER